MEGSFLVELECLMTGERRPLPAFLADRVEAGDQVDYLGRRWLVVDPTADFVT